jgi:hypothetical protein
MLLTSGEHNVERKAVGVDYGMDLGRRPATGTAKLLPGPRSISRAGEYYGAVDNLNVGIVTMRDAAQDTIPHACAAPPHEPVIAGRVGTVSRGQITPRRA